MIWTSKVSPLIKEIELRKPPVIVRVNKFTEDSAKKFHQEMAWLITVGRKLYQL